MYVLQGFTNTYFISNKTKIKNNIFLLAATPFFGDFPFPT